MILTLRNLYHFIKSLSDSIVQEYQSLESFEILFLVKKA